MIRALLRWRREREVWLAALNGIGAELLRAAKGEK